MDDMVQGEVVRPFVRQGIVVLVDWRHADAGVGIGMPALSEGAPEGLLDARSKNSRYQV